MIVYVVIEIDTEMSLPAGLKPYERILGIYSTETTARTHVASIGGPGIWRGLRIDEFEVDSPCTERVVGQEDDGS